MLYALIFAVLVASVSGAPNGGTGRVIGGTQATKGQFPFVVSISRRDQHICGGFIYNDRWVVTTAKCVYDKPQTELKVTVGALSLITPDPEEQIITILTIEKFSLYDPLVSSKHDIALIQLSRPIVFGPTAQPIRYDEIDELALPWDAKIVGWGATFEGGIPATRLRWGPIDNLMDDCRSYGLDEYIQNFMICAGSDAGTVSPCQYDEGTPLIQNANYGGVPEEIVVGIMAKNQGCVDLSVPSIYTRLATYYSWLLQTAGQQPAPTRSFVQSE